MCKSRRLTKHCEYVHTGTANNVHVVHFAVFAAWEMLVLLDDGGVGDYCEDDPHFFSRRVSG